MGDQGYFNSLGRSGKMDKTIDNILKFKFMEPLEIECNDTNGLCLNNVFCPEEVVTKILTFVNPENVLVDALVCKKWNNIIKSTYFWAQIYRRIHHKPPKNLPWYVFYCYLGQKQLNCNLLKNGNGQEGFNHWDIINEELVPFGIEWNPPLGCDILPENVPEFNGYTMCFVTNGETCVKKQEVDLLLQSKLLFYIVNKFGPDIYLSDWVAARRDCSIAYTLTCTLYQKQFDRFTKTVKHNIKIGGGGIWKKVIKTI